jgi:hypothetical protein
VADGLRCKQDSDISLITNLDLGFLPGLDLDNSRRPFWNNKLFTDSNAGRWVVVIGDTWGGRRVLPPSFFISFSFFFFSILLYFSL